jgi:hypothetical protein
MGSGARESSGWTEFLRTRQPLRRLVVHRHIAFNNRGCVRTLRWYRRSVRRFNGSTVGYAAFPPGPKARVITTVIRPWTHRPGERPRRRQRLITTVIGPARKKSVMYHGFYFRVSKAERSLLFKLGHEPPPEPHCADWLRGVRPRRGAFVLPYCDSVRGRLHAVGRDFGRFRSLSILVAGGLALPSLREAVLPRMAT